MSDPSRPKCQRCGLAIANAMHYPSSVLFRCVSCAKKGVASDGDADVVLDDVWARVPADAIGPPQQIELPNGVMATIRSIPDFEREVVGTATFTPEHTVMDDGGICLGVWEFKFDVAPPGARCADCGALASDIAADPKVAARCERLRTL